MVVCITVGVLGGLGKWNTPAVDMEGCITVGLGCGWVDVGGCRMVEE